MYVIKVYHNIIEVRGDEDLFKIFYKLSRTENWKSKFPSIVGLGWHRANDNQQVHYFKREALSYICSYLFECKKDFFMRGAIASECIPTDDFEEWNPPMNQEAAITHGYLNVPTDYKFQIPYYHRNAFGAWREHPPLL